MADRDARGSGAAQRLRGRQLRAFHRRVQMAVKMAVATAHHHSTQPAGLVVNGPPERRPGVLACSPGGSWAAFLQRAAFGHAAASGSWLRWGGRCRPRLPPRLYSGGKGGRGAAGVAGGGGADHGGGGLSRRRAAGAGAGRLSALPGAAGAAASGLSPTSPPSPLRQGQGEEEEAEEEEKNVPTDLLFFAPAIFVAIPAGLSMIASVGIAKNTGGWFSCVLFGYVRRASWWSGLCMVGGGRYSSSSDAPDGSTLELTDVRKDVSSLVVACDAGPSSMFSVRTYLTYPVNHRRGCLWIATGQFLDRVTSLAYFLREVPQVQFVDCVEDVCVVVLCRRYHRFNSLTEWRTFRACLWCEVPQVNSLTEWRTFLACLWCKVPQVQCFDRVEDVPGVLLVPRRAHLDSQIKLYAGYILSSASCCARHVANLSACLFDAFFTDDLVGFIWCVSYFRGSSSEHLSGGTAAHGLRVPAEEVLPNVCRNVEEKDDYGVSTNILASSSVAELWDRRAGDQNFVF